MTIEALGQDEWRITLECSPVADSAAVVVHGRDGLGAVSDLRWHGRAGLARATKRIWQQKPGRA